MMIAGRKFAAETEIGLDFYSREIVLNIICTSKSSHIKKNE